MMPCAEFKSFPACCPSQYRSLALQCMDPNPDIRPPFEVVIRLLSVIQSQVDSMMAARAQAQLGQGQGQGGLPAVPERPAMLQPAMLQGHESVRTREGGGGCGGGGPSPLPAPAAVDRAWCAPGPPSLQHPGAVVLSAVFLGDPLSASVMYVSCGPCSSASHAPTCMPSSGVMQGLGDAGAGAGAGGMQPEVVCGEQGWTLLSLEATTMASELGKSMRRTWGCQGQEAPPRAGGAGGST